MSSQQKLKLRPKCSDADCATHCLRSKIKHFTLCYTIHTTAATQDMFAPLVNKFDLRLKHGVTIIRGHTLRKCDAMRTLPRPSQCIKSSQPTDSKYLCSIFHAANYCLRPQNFSFRSLIETIMLSLCRNFRRVATTHIYSCRVR